MPISETQALIDKKIDEVMLAALDGDPVLNEKGEPVLDKDGKPRMMRPKAPMLQAIRSRMRDLGISRIPISDEDPAVQTAKRLDMEEGRDAFTQFRQSHGRDVDVPEMDDEDDDVATARTG